MKKIIYSVLLFVLACNSEDANNCFQTTGKIVQQEISVSTFEKILVNRDISVFIKEDALHTVTIEAGENLINDIEAKVVNNQLQLTNNNTCNLVRNYDAVKIYITAPNLIEIGSSTQFDIKSQGILNYDDLKLYSEDFNNPDYFTVGDFRLQLNVQNLRIVSNNLSSFYLSGTTNKLFVGFYSGAGRFEGETLIAQNVDIYHRGTNDIIVNPQLELKGELVSTGNLISKNYPPTVAVDELYTGSLIFD